MMCQSRDTLERCWALQTCGGWNFRSAAGQTVPIPPGWWLVREAGKPTRLLSARAFLGEFLPKPWDAPA